MNNGFFNKVNMISRENRMSKTRIEKNEDLQRYIKKQKNSKIFKDLCYVFENRLGKSEASRYKPVCMKIRSYGLVEKLDFKIVISCLRESRDKDFNFIFTNSDMEELHTMYRNYTSLQK